MCGRRRIPPRRLEILADRYDIARRLAQIAQQLLDFRADERNPSGPAHHDHFVDRLDAHARVLKTSAARSERPFDDRLNQRVEQRDVDFALVALAAVFQIDHGRGHKGEFLFRLNDGAAQQLNGRAIRGKIFAPLRLNIFQGDVHQQIVDVVAAQVRIAVSGQHFKDAFVQAEDGNVERAAAEIVNGDDALVALVEPVGERGGHRLVDQSQNFQTGDAAGVFRGLPLRVVEVGWNRDDGLRHGLSQSGLGVALELAENVRRDFRRRHDSVAEPQPQHLLIVSGIAAMLQAEGE